MCSVNHILDHSNIWEGKQHVIQLVGLLYNQSLAQNSAQKNEIVMFLDLYFCVFVKPTSKF